MCTEQKPCQRMTRAFGERSRHCSPQRRAGFHSGICSRSMPSSWRCCGRGAGRGRTGPAGRVRTPIRAPSRHSRGAYDPPVAAHEGLDRRGGVHVGDGDDRDAAVLIGFGAEDLGELFPAVLDLIDRGHVRHRAAGGEVGQDDRLVRLREQVGGLGHEVDAAEDDRLGLRMVLRGPGEHERVADVVGVLDDLDPLIVVAEQNDAIAEALLGPADAVIELFGGGLLVFLGDLTLTWGGGRDRVGQRGAGTVAGAFVDVPRGIEQLRRTHVVVGPRGGDVLEGEFDRGCRSHHRPSLWWAAGARGARDTARHVLRTCAFNCLRRFELNPVAGQCTTPCRSCRGRRSGPSSAWRCCCRGLVIAVGQGMA